MSEGARDWTSSGSTVGALASAGRPAWLSPLGAVPDKASSILNAATVDEALNATLLGLCRERPGVLAHAVRCVEPRSPLRPAGVLCGHDAIEHAALGSALFRLDPPGTGLTRAAVRERRPVWVASIADVLAFARGSLLGRYGIESGAAFPVFVGPKLAAVIELLSFDPLERDPQTEGVATEFTAQLQAAVQRHWTERAAEPTGAPSSPPVASPVPG